MAVKNGAFCHTFWLVNVMFTSKFARGKAVWELGHGARNVAGRSERCGGGEWGGVVREMGGREGGGRAHGEGRHKIVATHMEDVGRRWKTLLEDVGKPREIAWKTCF